MLKTGSLREETCKIFYIIHSAFHKGRKREDDLEILTKRLYPGPDGKFSVTPKERSVCLPFVHKGLSLLVEHGYKNFDPKFVRCEFHRRNYLSLGTKKARHKDLVWHYDDFQVEPWKVYSVIFYLRIDPTVVGADLLYNENGEDKKVRVDASTYVVFPGNIYHSPQHGSGFGCRDSVVLFIRRK